MNTDSITLHDPLDTDDYVHVYPRSARPSTDARSVRDVIGYVEVMEAHEQACVRLTRRQAHELHAYLGKLLGLSTPTPTAPLTASRAAEGAAKASRNRSWDVV